MTELDDEGPVGRRRTDVVGLRREAADDGTLTPEALERLDRHLATVARMITDLDGPAVVAVGTSAVRDAPNRDRVRQIVRDRLGADLTVVTGDQEAALSYAGARLAAPEGALTAVLDVGGASTEIAVGTGPRPDVTASVDVGAVRCLRGPVADDPPPPGAVRALRDAVARELSARWRDLPRFTEVIGLAGTCASLAGVDLGRFDRLEVHGHVISRARLEAIVTRLGAMRLSERRDTPGLHPDRAPVIVVGGAIVLAALDVLGAHRLRISERNLLDGAALAALRGELRIADAIS
jgi:exopolyphosphatase/guanosine-5'-triphosphate,3'-diphosphate pyrophosphatase